MSRIACGAVALLLSTAPLHAAGIERANQSIGIIFEPGRLVEIGMSWVRPHVDGTYAAVPSVLPAQPTGSVADGFGSPSLAYKQDFGDRLSGAVIIDRPYGADVMFPANPTGLLSGTGASVESTHVTGIVRWKGDNGFGVHGGVRYSSAKASVNMSGLAFSAAGLDNYHVDLDREPGWGWLAGVSWERPDIAARVALTYNSQISHDFALRESVNGGPDVPGHYKVVTPRSWNLEFQTGIAPRTLLMGSIRWVKWSEFHLDPPLFHALHFPGAEAGIIDLQDSTTWTIGIGRQFTDTWSGAALVSYEKPDRRLASPLAPTDGRLDLTVAGVYTRDNMKVTLGASWSRLHDAELQPDLSGPAGLGLPAASMTDNHAVGFGIRTAFSF